MAEVYENVLAGAFIYSLGVVAGRKADPDTAIMDSVNFFQQTPTDRTVGDLLAVWRGKSFLIEFKKSIGQLKDEISKDGKPGLGLKLFADDQMKAISSNCHFIGYGEYEKENDLVLTDLVFQKYLSVLMSGRSRKAKPTDVPRWSEFINRMLTDSHFGASREQFAHYLDFLVKYAEAPITTTAATSSSAGIKTRRAIQGILTTVSPTGRVVSFAYTGYNNLMKLLTEKITLEQHLEQQISYRQSLNADIKIERKIGPPSNNLGGHSL